MFHEFASKRPTLIRSIRKALGYYGAKALRIRNAQTLYEKTCEQAERGTLYQVCGMEVSVVTWFHMSLVHIWMVIVRLRNEGEEGDLLSQEFFNFFWKDLESRLIETGYTNPFQLGKEMKTLARGYFGTVIAYDEGLLEGDTGLAEALWRNLFGVLKEPSIEALNCMVHYVRRELGALELNDVIMKGYIAYGDPVVGPPVQPNK